jgi:hypothetical protein
MNLLAQATAPVTPATADYLFGGLAVVALIMIAFVGSLIIRYQNTRKDIALAEQLAEE